MSDQFAIEDQSAVIALLSDPASHGGEVPARVDTHGAMVFLTADRAYKVKRAVAFSYMDFSTREKRLAALREELRVNKRTAPDLYLGIAPIVQGTEGLRLGEIGASVEDAVDYALVMRRFEATFDEIAANGDLDGGQIVAIAEQTAGLHRSAEVNSQPDFASRIVKIIQDAVWQARRFPELLPEQLVDAVERQLLMRAQAAAAQIKARSAAGLERHCHGDLHLRNICLFRGKPTLFDAIEFNPGFARIDLLYDLAFLLMDLAGRQMGGLANLALNTYLDRRLADRWPDEEGLALMPLFIGLRALISAEVGANMVVVQARPADAAKQAGLAAGRLALAAACLTPEPPRLIAVGGLSGSGKSTLAGALAPLLGAPLGARWLRSDVTRKALAGVGPLDRLQPEAYTPEHSAQVYRHLLDAAADCLAGGHSVVLDAVYARPGERFAVEALAARLGVPFQGIWLDVPVDQRVGRIEGRRDDPSDANATVARAQEGYGTGDIRWAKLDADRSPEAVLEAARGTLRGFLPDCVKESGGWGDEKHRVICAGLSGRCLIRG